MATSNHISKVAVVGAGGNIGKFITEALLKTGKHTVTAITRIDGQSKLPEGVVTKRVDYDKSETVVDALRGQDALVITLSGQTPKDTETRLIEAAGAAGIPWILPNDWSPDTANEALVKDVSMFQPKVDTRKFVEDLGKSSYIAMSTGFWYEWLLPVRPAFGFDFANQHVTLFDEGETKISLSTWPQIGRAVAALLSLPVKAETSTSEVCLDNFKNKVVYINSFTVSQRDILESILRVTGTNDEDWTVSKEPSQQRFLSGFEEAKEGKHSGFAKIMCTRVFYPDGCGDFEHGKGTLNSILNLPEVDIDEATKVAVERAKMPQWTD